MKKLTPQGIFPELVGMMERIRHLRAGRVAPKPPPLPNKPPIRTPQPKAKAPKSKTQAGPSQYLAATREEFATPPKAGAQPPAKSAKPEVKVKPFGERLMSIGPQVFFFLWLGWFFRAAVRGDMDGTDPESAQVFATILGGLMCLLVWRALNILAGTQEP